MRLQGFYSLARATSVTMLVLLCGSVVACGSGTTEAQTGNDQDLVSADRPKAVGFTEEIDHLVKQIDKDAVASGPIWCAANSELPLPLNANEARNNVKWEVSTGLIDGKVRYVQVESLKPQEAVGVGYSSAALYYDVDGGLRYVIARANVIDTASNSVMTRIYRSRTGEIRSTTSSVGGKDSTMPAPLLFDIDKALDAAAVVAGCNRKIGK